MRNTHGESDSGFGAKRRTSQSARRWALFVLFHLAWVAQLPAQEIILGIDTNSRPILRWAVPDNRFFRIESAGTLHATNWTLVSYTNLDVLTATNGTWEHALRSLRDREFFRLRSVGIISNHVVRTVVDAAGNGDHTTLAAALAGLPPEGGVVEVRAGTYLGGVAISSGITLRGAGMAQTRILAPVWNGQGPREEALSVMGNDVTIESLSVDVQLTNQPAASDANGLITLSGARLTVRHCRVLNGISQGVSVLGPSSDVLVENCEILNVATNEIPAGTSGAHQAGIRCEGTLRPTVRNNFIRGWSHGIALAGGVTNGLVEGNQVWDNLGFRDAAHQTLSAALLEIGAAGAVSTGNRWQSNTVSGSAGHGLEVGSFVIGAQFIGNTFARAGRVSGQGELWRIQAGTTPIGSNHLFEANLVVSDGRNESCEFNGALDGLLIRSNQFTGFRHAATRGALLLNGTGTNAAPVITANLFTACQQGIVLTGATGGILVQSNQFTSVPSNAVAINAAGGHAHQIIGNVLTATNYAVGIRLEAGTGHLVASNQLTLPGQHLLILSASNRIEGNRLEETGVPVTGIVRIESTNAVDNTARNNLIIGFNADSVAFNFVDAAATNTATSNVVLRATPAFYASAGAANTVSSPTEPPCLAFVGSLGTNGTVLGQLPGIRLEGGSLIIASTTLSNALTLLPAQGASVTIDAGTYDGSFVLPGHTTIRGQGTSQTILRAPVDGTGQLFFITNGQGNILLENLTLDGRRSAYTSLPAIVGGVNGIITVDAENVTLRNCRIRDAVNNGVFVGTAIPGFLIENCLVENSATNNTPAGTLGGHGYGIFCAGSASPVIRSNTVRGWAQAVGLWPGVTNGLVEHNQIVDNFGFLDAGHRETRSACEDYGAGVVPHGWNLWRSNVVDGSTSHCLEIAQGVTASRFVGNTLRRPGQISNNGNHFELTGGLGQTNRDVVLEGNTILSDGQRADACSVNGLAYNAVITNNLFSGFSHPGSLGPIFLGGLNGVQGTVIVGNTFTNSRYGVRINADTTGFIIRSNTFTAVRQSDAVIWVDTTGAGRVEGNTLETTAPMVGIKLDDATGAGVPGGQIVAGNHLRLPGSGVLCLTPSNTITNNLIEETVSDGGGTILLLGPRATRNLVAGNTVMTFSPWALRVASGAALNTFTNNIIPLDGLRVDEDSTNNVFLNNRPAQ